MEKTEREKQLERENAELKKLYGSWRGIGIAYIVLCEKTGIGDMILPMLTDEEKALIKKELSVFLERFS